MMTFTTHRLTGTEKVKEDDKWTSEPTYIFIVLLPNFKLIAYSNYHRQLHKRDSKGGVFDIPLIYPPQLQFVNGPWWECDALSHLSVSLAAEWDMSHYEQKSTRRDQQCHRAKKLITGSVQRWVTDVPSLSGISCGNGVESTDDTELI